MSQFASDLFVLSLSASGFIVLVGSMFALMGLFSKVEATKYKFYSLAAKLLLAFVLVFVIGFGIFITSFNAF